MSKVADIVGAIITVALAAVLVKSAHTSQVLAALGRDFSGSLATAERG